MYILSMAPKITVDCKSDGGNHKDFIQVSKIVGTSVSLMLQPKLTNSCCASAVLSPRTGVATL